MKYRPKNTHIERYAHFEHIYSSYSSRIYNFVLKISRGNSYVSEEITQIVFLKLWEKFDDIDDEENLKSYLFTIARNTLVNYLKRETLEYIYLNHLKGADPACFTTSDNTDATFLNSYVINLINELPEMRQKVFRMSRMHHLSVRQIADELSISPSTVETHISLALKYLREELRRRYGILSLVTGLLFSTISNSI